MKSTVKSLSVVSEPQEISREGLCSMTSHVPIVLKTFKGIYRTWNQMPTQHFIVLQILRPVLDYRFNTIKRINSRPFVLKNILIEIPLSFDSNLKTDTSTYPFFLYHIGFNKVLH